MFFVKILFIIIAVHQKFCHANVQITLADVASEELPKTTELCNGNTTSGKSNQPLQFRLPFMDMEIDNDRNLHIMQESHKQIILVLHGNELYQMFIKRDEKRLTLIGVLQGDVMEMEPLGAKIIYWQGNLLMTVALEEYIDIYQIPETMVMNTGQAPNVRPKRNTETVPILEPIQQVTLPGRFNKFYLTDATEEQVMLIVAVNYTKLNGKLRTFIWSNTYFNPIEDLTVSLINVFQLVGTHPKYLITGRVLKHQTKTVLTINEISSPELTLEKRQTLTITSRTVQSYTYLGRNYLIACSVQQSKCSHFRMSNGQFSLFRNRAGKDLSFAQIVAGQSFLVATRRNEVSVYKSARLDCYSSYAANETDVSSIMVHESTEPDVYFIVLNYQRPLHTIMRMVEIETAGGELLGAVGANATDVEELSDIKQHQHLFEEAVGKLQSILLKRKAAMDVFRKTTNIISPRLSVLKLKHSVRVEDGKIGLIHIKNKSLLSPMQLLAKVENMQKTLRRRRFSRSVDKGLLEKYPTLKIKRLSVKNLLYEGKLLPGFYFDNSKKDRPILSVRPELTTRKLNTTRLFTPESLNEEPTKSKTTIPLLKMHCLQVERINNVSWAEFHDNLFLKDRDTRIEGRLIMQANTTVRNLQTPKLNKLVVADLFNLKEPQVVKSNLTIANVFVSNLQAEHINGLKFSEDIVFRGKPTLVETPVKIFKAYIGGNILLGYDDKSIMSRAGDADEVELQQYYTGKVIINGSLTINNLALEQAEQTKVFVGGMPFSVDILRQNYLLKSEPQEINTTVVFGNAKVTVPLLTTKFLNDHPTEEHLLDRDQQQQMTKPLFIGFASVQVLGDVICENNTSNLFELQQNIVLNGEAANITGVKTFQAPLTIDHLMTLELNDLPVHELVPKSELQHSFTFGGSKTFDKIVVSEVALVAQSLNASYLNNLPLKDLLNYDYHLDHLYLPNELTVENIVFKKINGIPFDEVFNKFNLRDQKLMLHKDLIIEGSVRFAENLAVQKINNITWQTYVDSLVRTNENAVIRGQKRFLKELTVAKALNAQQLNGVNIKEVFDNILLRSKPQLITGEYTFDTIHLTNLDVSIINDMPTASFIDMRSNDTIVIEGDLVVPKLTVFGNVEGNFVNHFQFDALEQRLQDFPDRNYRNLVVLGNATWNASTIVDRAQQERLEYLYKNAVRSTGDQVITGNIKMKRPLIHKMFTTTTFPHDIDFDFIAKDALLKNATLPQVVTAAKTFVKPLRMQSTTTASHVRAKMLNNIDVLRLNASLYRVSSGAPIMGTLHFNTPPKVQHLHVQGTVNDINTELIYGAPNVSLPPVKLRELIIENALEVGDINDVSINHFLANRVKKHGPAQEIFGTLSFEHLVLDKEIVLQSINDIPIDDLVFTKSKHLQAITGAKFIEGDLVLDGPAHVMHFNGQHLVDSFKQSIFTSANHHFDNLEIDRATFERGVVLQDGEIASGSRASRTEEETEEKLEVLNSIKRQLHEIDVISHNKLKNRQQHFMYLDYDLSANISWRRPNETIEETQLFQVKRSSYCTRQFVMVQTAKSGRNMYLRNLTTSFLTVNVNELTVRVENYCTLRYRNVRSKIKISDSKLYKVFGMKKPIETVAIYAASRNVSFVLLHAVDMLGKRNEVRVLRIDSATSDVKDWQSIKSGVGKVMRLFQFENAAFIVSSGLTDKHLPAVSIYAYSAKTERFDFLQVLVGDFDIFEMIALPAGKHQLILSCQHCQRIHIYACEPATRESCEVLQIIKLTVLIDRMSTFALDDGSFYLLVMPETGQNYYYLYKYKYIQGWLLEAYGYMPNIQLALPLATGDLSLSKQKAPPLLLLCGSDNCSLVRAVLQ